MLENVQAAVIRMCKKSVVGRYVHGHKNTEPLQFISGHRTYVISINTAGSPHISLDCPFLDAFAWFHKRPVSCASPSVYSSPSVLPPFPYTGPISIEIGYRVFLGGGGSVEKIQMSLKSGNNIGRFI
jgi:hypothetical protein